MYLAQGKRPVVCCLGPTYNKLSLIKKATRCCVGRHLERAVMRRNAAVESAFAVYAVLEIVSATNSPAYAPATHFTTRSYVYICIFRYIYIYMYLAQGKRSVFCCLGPTYKKLPCVIKVRQTLIKISRVHLKRQNIVRGRSQSTSTAASQGPHTS